MGLRWADVKKLAREYDKKMFISEYLKWGVRFRKSFEKTEQLDKLPRRIVVVGMGGSGIVGDIMRDYIRLRRLNLQIHVYKGPSPPRYVIKDSLLIAVSHSGNTLETISMVKESFNLAKHVTVITTDGLLEEYADEYGWDKIIVEAALAPRAGLPQMLGAALKLLNKRLKLNKKIPRVSRELDKLGKRLSLDKRFNEAFNMALSIWGHVPIIYSTDFYRGVLHRIKSSFNENAKIHAYYAIYPEAYHNEVEAYESVDTRHIPIFLRHDKDELDYMTEYLNRHGFKYLTYTIDDRDALAGILKTIMFFDIVSIYLAYLRHVDPYEIKAINEIKEMRR